MLPTLAKGGLDFCTGNWVSLGKNGIDLIAALGLKSSSTEEIAYLLIINGLTNSIQELVNSNLALFSFDSTNSEQLTKNLTEALNNYTLIINQDFFERPQNLPFLKDVKQGFLNWLKTTIANPHKAESISNRLPEYFASALFHEWKKNKSQYQVILDDLDNPFTEVSEKQKEWNYYRAWLQKQIQEPVFQEAFSLKQIY